MAKKPSKSRHKNPALYLRPHPRIRAQLNKLAEQNGTKVSVEAIRLLREGLTREGFWPAGGKPE